MNKTLYNALCILAIMLIFGGVGWEVIAGGSPSKIGTVVTLLGLVYGFCLLIVAAPKVPVTSRSHNPAGRENVNESH